MFVIIVSCSPGFSDVTTVDGHRVEYDSNINMIRRSGCRRL